MPTIFAEVVWVTSVHSRYMYKSYNVHTECLVSMNVSNDEGVSNAMVGGIEISFNDIGDPYTIA